jgi:SAM-dependent MidA family methyltransferase
MRDLPCLKPELQAHSAALTDFIAQEIQQNKAHSISFARFMELALYHPTLGYYMGSLPKLGEQGDFVTAPEISPLFAHCLGRQCVQVFSELGLSDILEIGAGSGKLAGDLLLFLEKKGVLPKRYQILEISPYLRQRQQAWLKVQIPHLFYLIEWLVDWPPHPIKGVVFANEVVDALPVHRFLWTQDSIQEMRVTYDEQGFAWHVAPLESLALKVRLERLKLDYFAAAECYESEICLDLAAWMNKLSAVLRQGLILLIDYGFPAHAYYHPERCQGTFLCYYQHRAHAKPFTLVGLQDLTASVDFSLLARCARNKGLKIAGFTSQAAFLLNNDLLQAVEEYGNILLPMDINRQVYRLTSPNEMGELIKVIGLVREYKSSLQGFIQYDKRMCL